MMKRLSFREKTLYLISSVGWMDGWMDGSRVLGSKKRFLMRMCDSVLLDSFDSQQTQRYEAFRRANLNKAAVKKLANQVLSQSVTAGVGTAICGFSKVFTGEIVELALKVQKEWADADVEGEGVENIRKRTKSDGSLGPLLPDHLREAARRYRLELRGAVGFRGSIGGGCGNALGAGPGVGGEGAIGGVGRLFR
ncbi:hTAFII28-like protein conserved region-domain-containing protein [Tuber borchii]|uniref:HTAFII28-like protein conserved region-domain-containing protein n=1 Tax=Tuber borchii TaxID=42251 RepID=A0A2T6ZQD8_TUBBO|nr:hTAFII28-like protein conserved region-domain-containing protein [Tuber borchii]